MVSDGSNFEMGGVLLRWIYAGLGFVDVLFLTTSEAISGDGVVVEGVGRGGGGRIVSN